MAKRRRPPSPPATRDIPPAPEPLYVDESGGPAQVTANILGHNIDLQEIRQQASDARANVSQTIAELEAWRAEIDSTIAFLRATRS